MAEVFQEWEDREHHIEHLVKRIEVLGRKVEEIVISCKKPCWKHLEKISLPNLGTIIESAQRRSHYPTRERLGTRDRKTHLFQFIKDHNQNNEQILVRLENIEHLQRSMVLELYKMKRASPNITHASPYEGGCSSSHMRKEPLFFNPLGSFMNTYPSFVSFEAN